MSSHYEVTCLTQCIPNYSHSNCSQLIDDFKVVQDANFPQKLQPWEHYETLVTKLMQLVPVSLPETEYDAYDMERGLHDLESRHGLKPQQQGQHPLLPLITKELHQHNICAVKLYRSLVALQDTLNGKKSFMCSTAHTLTAILQNRVPYLWNYLTDIVPAQKEELKLLPLLQLHRHRVLFYNDSIQRGCPTLTVNILWFSKPNALMSVLCQCFADKHKISLEDIYMQAEVCGFHVPPTASYFSLLLCSCLQQDLRNVVFTIWPYMEQSYLGLNGMRGGII